MKVDITPLTLPANDMWKICLPLREIPHVYCFLTKDGEEFTTLFSDKEIEEFCQSRTVSEMKKIWEDDLKRQLALYEKCIKIGKHPHWTTDVKHLVPKYLVTGKRAGSKMIIGEGTKLMNERIVTIKAPLTKSQREYLIREVERLKKIVGELTFVKYV